MNEEPDSIACPHCGKNVPWTRASRYRPFCSQRCQLIDLGEWAAGNYRVPGEASPAPEKPDSESLQ